MCGIAGIISFNGQANEKLERIDSAIKKLNKRGPDNTSVQRHENVALAHARLSIIDTSNAAHQPLSDASNRYTIVFNGEIFNFKEYRSYIQSKGYTLKTESDTEVLLYLYIIDGPACLAKLNGFFAFAIWDKSDKSLFIARDRYGIKPLYIYQDADYFCFASELKALTEFGFKKEIDNSSLLTYFHLNYIPAPHSIYSNVKKLEQGHCLHIKDAKVEKNMYYEIPNLDTSFSTISYDDAKSKLYQLMDESVQLRMISDVPLGAFLSGGIDSSVITALAAKHTNHLNTFSIGFADEPLFDETSYAKLVAKKYNTEHTVFSLRNKDLYEHLNEVLDYIDEPFADSSALNVFILSKETRKYATVALSGDGADEIFAGYNKHEAERRARLQSFSNNLIKNVQPVFGLFPKSRNSKIGNTFRKLEKFSKGLSLDAADRYWRWAGFMEDAELLQYIRPYMANHRSIEIYRQRRQALIGNINEHDFNSVLRADMHMVLEGDMLVKADRMSMANSLEIRVPFLDYRVVDFAFSLPAEYKIDAFQRKKIVKETFADLLPPELMNRGKQGFEVPLLKWFRTELRSTITDKLMKDNFIAAQNIFSGEEVWKLKQQLFSNSPNDAVAKTWAMLVFQSWYQKNMM